MKTKYRYSLFMLLLCFSLKAQAQRVVALETRLAQLPTIEAEKIISLIYESPSVMFVTKEGHAAIYYGQAQEISEILIRRSSDFITIKRAFQSQLKEPIILNIVWDGRENILLPTGMLQQLEGLKYVYIRSSQTLDSSIIQEKLRNLLQTLNEKEGIEILYGMTTNLR